ncbi:cytochrome p450 protein [Rutstroemia sp. NJR-2017a WRK4]|nr:cytochrome p450 protein [Rutstroemia sp. NJR-2017a WRK4]
MANLTLFVPFLLGLSFILWNAVCLVRNYRIAQKIGIPVRVLIASGDNPVWLLVSGFVLPIVRFLFGDCDIARYSRPGWEFKDKYRMHEELGDAVIQVSAGHNWLYVCNAEAVNDIFKRREDFDRPPDLLAVLAVFGPNISTAVGADWQRQRKITSAPFNDQNNSLVWIEALRQADEMLQFWKSLPGPIIRTSKDTRTFALHVLSGAGFGKSYAFKQSGQQVKSGRTFNYRDSLALVLENCLLILVLGPKFLSKFRLPWPSNWKQIGQATVDFRYYMTEMLNDERSAIAQGKTRSATFTNSLLRASKEMSHSSSDVKVAGGADDYQGLTEDEIYGNMFVYNFAGHDTTAIVLNWAIYVLAAHPEVQDWISEEINAVITNDMPSTWDYKVIYPKLNRCYAIMLETVRLWNPLVGICKSTFEAPKSLTINNKTIVIPPDTRIIPNTNALHSHPRYWGSDGLEWRPQRWILSKPKSDSTSAALNSPPVSDIYREYVRTPPKGSYVPWSDGVRPCPGKKFSQVEFVGAMVALFKRHRVEIVREGGETVEQAKERVMAVVKDNVMGLLLQMRSPEKVGLRWVERK